MKLVLASLVLLALAACSSETPTAPALQAGPSPTPPSVSTAESPPTVLFATRVERRAPTLAPATATLLPSATSVPPTATLVPSPSASPTAQPSPTPVPASPIPTTRVPATAIPATRVPASPTRLVTATPTVAPGVYVTALSVEPPQPRSKPATFFFRVRFLNTTGKPQSFLWRVLIFPAGAPNSTGDPQGDVRILPAGVSDQVTRVWDINTPINCESYTAQPVWQDDAGRRTPFLQPDGAPLTLAFQVCP